MRGRWTSSQISSVAFMIICGRGVVKRGPILHLENTARKLEHPFHKTTTSPLCEQPPSVNVAKDFPDPVVAEFVALPVLHWIFFPRETNAGLQQDAADRQGHR